MPFQPLGHALLGPLAVGAGHPVRIMAVINASPESFYRGSVASGPDAVHDAAAKAAADGADLLDIGAMSTAPYRETRISEAEEADRMGAAVEAARAATGLPVSADTSRAGVARVALAAGATIVNDITGMLGDETMAGLVATTGASCILMANESSGPVADASPAVAVADLLALSLAAARDASIPDDRIVLDPGIGFFRNRPIPWHQWDLELVRAVPRFSLHDRPVLIGVSRKSFIGSLLGRPDPADRLAGSLIAAVHAARLGAAVIRTHDVAATRDALRMAELIDG